MHFKKIKTVLSLIIATGSLVGISACGNTKTKKAPQPTTSIIDSAVANNYDSSKRIFKDTIDNVMMEDGKVHLHDVEFKQVNRVPRNEIYPVLIREKGSRTLTVVMPGDPRIAMAEKNDSSSLYTLNNPNKTLTAALVARALIANSPVKTMVDKERDDNSNIEACFFLEDKYLQEAKFDNYAEQMNEVIHDLKNFISSYIVKNKTFGLPFWKSSMPMEEEINSAFVDNKYNHLLDELDNEITEEAEHTDSSKTDLMKLFQLSPIENVITFSAIHAIFHSSDAPIIQKFESLYRDFKKATFNGKSITEPGVIKAAYTDALHELYFRTYGAAMKMVDEEINNDIEFITDKLVIDSVWFSTYARQIVVSDVIIEATEEINTKHSNISYSLISISRDLRRSSSRIKQWWRTNKKDLAKWDLSLIEESDLSLKTLTEKDIQDFKKN